MKKVELKIKFCNASCPYFYHKFDDHENIYCDKLNCKVCNIEPDCYEMMFDYMERPIPAVCPLDDAE